MKRAKVRSSNIKSVGYDADEKKLEVEFHSGRVYRYSGVPPLAMQEFWRAKSLGRYFNDVIRKGYKYEEVIEEEPDTEDFPEPPGVIRKAQARRLKK